MNLSWHWPGWHMVRERQYMCLNHAAGSINGGVFQSALLGCLGQSCHNGIISLIPRWSSIALAISGALGIGFAQNSSARMVASSTEQVASLRSSSWLRSSWCSFSEWCYVEWILLWAYLILSSNYNSTILLITTNTPFPPFFRLYTLDSSRHKRCYQLFWSLPII